MLFIPALLAVSSFVLASDRRSIPKHCFTDVYVYGVNRCTAIGLGPTGDSFSIQSPIRKGTKYYDELAEATVSITTKGQYVASHYNGAVVALLRNNEMLYPLKLKNKESKLLTIKDKRNGDIEDAHSYDKIVIFVPHTERLAITKTTFYKAFSGRDASNEALAKHFVEKYIDPSDSISARFTLVIATVRRYADVDPLRYYEIVDGPWSAKQQDDSGDRRQVTLSFNQPPPTMYQPGLSTIPSQMVSPGRHISNTQSGHTVVNSQAASPYASVPTNNIAPLSFQPPTRLPSNPHRGDRSPRRSDRK